MLCNRTITSSSITGTSVTTSFSGTSTGSIKYFSFGQTRSGTVTTAQKFTGQRLDSTGLYYYGARYYDSGIGRFLSPDTLVQITPNSPDMQLAFTVSYSDIDILLKLNQAQREGNYYKGGSLDPQLLNRYSYARNNPLKYSDSSGHWIWAVVGGVVGGLVGLGAYALTHNDNFNWGQAAIWAGAGAIIGATLGAATPTAMAMLAPTSVWAMNALQRGIAIEQRLGGYMGNFPTIDKFINGVATSIKSINLMSKSYQNINTLTNTIQGYVNKLASFQGAEWGGYVVRADEITNRVLQLAIPPGASQAQLQAIEQLKQWALTKGVEITISVIK